VGLVIIWGDVLFWFEYLEKNNENVIDIHEQIPYVITNELLFNIIFDFDLLHMDENFLGEWMESIEGYPLYFCIEIFSFEKQFDKFCKEYSFNPKTIIGNEDFRILEVSNKDKFRELLNIVLTMASSGRIAFWVTKNNIFSNNNHNEIQIIEGQSLFSIGHDCESIVVLSNDNKFKNEEEIINYLRNCKRYFE